MDRSLGSWSRLGSVGLLWRQGLLLRLARMVGMMLRGVMVRRGRLYRRMMHRRLTVTRIGLVIVSANVVLRLLLLGVVRRVLLVRLLDRMWLLVNRSWCLVLNRRLLCLLRCIRSTVVTAIAVMHRRMLYGLSGRVLNGLHRRMLNRLVELLLLLLLLWVR